MPFVQQFQLVYIAHAVALPLGTRHDFLVGLRRDIRAALQEQAVEMLRVVAQADVARVQHTLMADRRNREDEHIPRHDPVDSSRYCSVLQCSFGARFRMEDARRHADAQGHALPRAIENLPRAPRSRARKSTTPNPTAADTRATVALRTTARATHSAH